jgi:beta-aspartyl-peptidase (threonine type)
MWSLVVHGGAGAIDPAASAAHRAGCARAAEAGAAILAAGGAALDAVVAAVQVLEDDPTFNAGIGGAVDADGLVHHDAAVMRGADLAYGAVGAVLGVRSPVALARRVLEDGRHALLVGPGAVRFARAAGVDLVDPRRMVAEPSRAAYWAASAEPVAAAAERAGAVGDTVGAVARDARGGFAAATSTGGLLGKLPGRVGDSPIAGAGTYARDDWGGISATGHGETILKTVLGYAALSALAQAAPGEGRAILARALEDATRRVGGRGGLIALDAAGQPLHVRNTRHMGAAWLVAGGRVETDF